MGALSVLRSRVRNNVGNRADKNSIIDVLLNNVVNDLSRKYQWNDLMATTTGLELNTGDYQVALGNTIRLVERIKILPSAGSYSNVKVYDRQTFRDLYNKIVPTDTGTPTACFIAGRQITFNKLSDADNMALYLDTFVYATDMTDDADTPSIFGIDELIVAMATSRLYMHLKQADEAKEWHSLAQVIMASSLDEIIGPPVDHLEPS